MRILVVTQYYWPEYFVITELCETLVELGHDVKVMTGKPNYPQGAVFEGYTEAGVTKELRNGVQIFRVPLRARRKGAIGLVRNYLSFVLSGLRYGGAFAGNEKADAVLVYAPSPITAAIPAVLVKRKVSSPLAIWVQDLWPESLAATGYIKNKRALSLVNVLVKWVYSRADFLLAQSHSFVDELTKYKAKDDIFYFPNFIRSPTGKVEKGLLSRKCGRYLQGGFNVVFAGNIGTAQSIPTLVEAFRRLKEENCNLIFAGEGSMYDWAKNVCNESGIRNVYFLGQLDNSLMPSLFSEADALLVSLTNRKIFEKTVPGKTQSYLAAGRPIIVSANGEVSNLIESNKAGVVCEAENPIALAEKVSYLKDLCPGKREEMGANGQKLFFSTFEVERQASNLIDILTKYSAVGGR
ncbi:MAG: glycosyltransferase WbuB [Bacteroidetes bacterium]|nr:MAG: glycosyltransferase WbuB [Bacteroidota bacterium]